MKKRLLCFCSVILIFSLATASFSACSKSNKKKAEKESSSQIESGTVSFDDLLSANTEDGTDIETEKTTESEKVNEKDTLPVESDTDDESETEAEIETQTSPKASLKYFSYGNGTCAVTGIGTYTDVYVIIPEKSPQGDIVTVIEDMAFFENASIKAVQIPSTVMSIGEMAFGGCSSLVYISVDPNNKVYTEVSGVLYSKDKSRLICFPSANQASEIFISVNVTEIANMAFYSTPSLKKINYGGTLSDWNKIKIGDKNYGIYSASLSFAVTE